MHTRSAHVGHKAPLLNIAPNRMPQRQQNDLAFSIGRVCLLESSSISLRSCLNKEQNIHTNKSRHLWPVMAYFSRISSACCNCSSSFNILRKKSSSSSLRKVKSISSDILCFTVQQFLRERSLIFTHTPLILAFIDHCRCYGNSSTINDVIKDGVRMQ